MIRFVPLESAIQYWKRLSGYEGEIDMLLMKGLAHDCVDSFMEAELCAFRLKLLDVTGYEARLPSDYHQMNLAACTKEVDQRYKLGHAVQWIKDYPATSECDVEINLICPECHKENCSEHGQTIELEMDKLFQRDNPDMAVSHWRHYAGFGKPINDSDGFATTIGSGDMIYEGFEVMYPRVDEGNFWNTNYYLGDCAANMLPKIVGPKYYKIDQDKLITDFKEGQILISYLGKRMDKDGYLLMPDLPLSYRTIAFYLDAAMMRRRWLRRLEVNAERAYAVNDAKYVDTLGELREEITTPDPQSWVYQVKKHIWRWNDDYIFRPSRI